MWPEQCTAHLSFHTRNWLKQTNDNVERINTMEKRRSIFPRGYKCSECVVRLLLKATFFLRVRVHSAKHVCVRPSSLSSHAGTTLKWPCRTQRTSPLSDYADDAYKNFRRQLLAAEYNFFPLWHKRKSGNGDWGYSARLSFLKPAGLKYSYTPASSILEVVGRGREVQRINCAWRNYKNWLRVYTEQGAGGPHQTAFHRQV